ncbi:MAG: nuclear transport factor 2 family protein, partial [Geminicoccaceae bacterium]
MSGYSGWAAFWFACWTNITGLIGKAFDEKEGRIVLRSTYSVVLTSFGLATGALAADFDGSTAHGPFVDAFNNRDWDAVKAVLTEDSVFHRATGEEVFIGPDAIVGRFSETIGAPDQWNVKFARLDSTSHLAGKDGRVVERGDFAVTAGADDSGCYAGSYMATWM